MKTNTTSLRASRVVWVLLVTIVLIGRLDLSSEAGDASAAAAVPSAASSSESELH